MVPITDCASAARALVAELGDVVTRSVFSAAVGLLAARDSSAEPDDLLDAGAVGLTFFDRFHAAATRAGFEQREYESYERSYRAESGIDLRLLRDDVANIVAALCSTQESLDMLTRVAERIPDVWNVENVESMVDRIELVSRQGRSDLAALPVVPGVVDELARTVRIAVADKAFKIASLARETIGGLHAPEVEHLTRAAIGEYGPAGAVLARPWIDLVFRPVYLDVREEFDRACAQCAAAMTDSYAAATAVVSQLYPADDASGALLWERPTDSAPQEDGARETHVQAEPDAPEPASAEPVSGERPDTISTDASTGAELAGAGPL